MSQPLHWIGDIDRVRLLLFRRFQLRVILSMLQSLQFEVVFHAFAISTEGIDKLTADGGHFVNEYI